MSKDFWNDRYSDKEFAYGINPNKFFKEQVGKLRPGNALFLGEGEGRNAVYAAKLGWIVDAVDFSSSAKDKALSLANKNNVTINYDVCDLNDFIFKENFYDLVVMIFLHLPIELSKNIFMSSSISLKQQGNMIVVTFSKDQINNTSGGPKSIELLYSENDILSLTQNLQIDTIESKEIELDEGEYHKGKANVIRFVGTKM
ncbi:MAG: class I SAM-dependent methyltransferase [Ignavibacteriota bacterium]